MHERRLHHRELKRRYTERNGERRTKLNLDYFLGLDESNHGVIPEILVTALSTSQEDAQRGNYPKLRRGEEGIQMVLREGFDFRFLLVPNRELTSALYDLKVKSAVIAEMAEAFGLTRVDRCGIYVDGRFDGLKDSVNNAFSEKGKGRPGEVIVQKSADRTYRVVNAADTVARSLRRIYDQNGEMGLAPYVRRRITHEFMLEALAR